jgi:hypothetical protein
MTLVDTIARSSIPVLAARIGRARGLSPIAVSLLGFAAYKLFEHLYLKRAQRPALMAPVRRAAPKKRAATRRAAH